MVVGWVFEFAFGESFLRRAKLAIGVEIGGVGGASHMDRSTHSVERGEGLLRSLRPAGRLDLALAALGHGRDARTHFVAVAGRTCSCSCCCRRVGTNSPANRVEQLGLAALKQVASLRSLMAIDISILVGGGGGGGAHVWWWLWCL